jgi:hypothetical protein
MINLPQRDPCRSADVLLQMLCFDVSSDTAYHSYLQNQELQL